MLYIVPKRQIVKMHHCLPQADSRCKSNGFVYIGRKRAVFNKCGEVYFRKVANAAIVENNFRAWIDAVGVRTSALHFRPVDKSRLVIRQHLTKRIIKPMFIRRVLEQPTVV